MKKLTSTDECLVCGGDIDWETVDFGADLIYQMGQCVACDQRHYAEYPLRHIVTVDANGEENHVE